MFPCHWLLDSYQKVDMRSVMCTVVLVDVVHVKVRDTDHSAQVLD